jgi:hypothetical protein
MAKPLINLDFLRQFFVTRDKNGKSYGKISRNELRTRHFNMDEDMADILNSEICHSVSETERSCVGRVNSQEVDRYLTSHPETSMGNLLILKDLELEVGHPLFTHEATDVFKKRFAEKIVKLYNYPDIQNIRREISYDPDLKKKVYRVHFTFMGHAMEMTNGGFKFEAKIWDPYRGEAGAMEKVKILFYQSDLWVSGDGNGLLLDPMVHTRFIPSLEKTLLLERALEKFFDEGKYQFESQRSGDDPAAPSVDLPIMVYDLDEDRVHLDAWRFENEDSDRVIKVELSVNLTKVDQDNFYSELPRKK